MDCTKCGAKGGLIGSTLRARDNHFFKEMAAIKCVYRGFYQRFRSNNDDEFDARLEYGSMGRFHKELYNDNISYFETTQDANIGGKYLRCFYVLKDKPEKIFEEVPLDKPKFRFIGSDKVKLPSNNLSNAEILGYMIENFNCAKRSYCLYGEAIEASATLQSQIQPSSNQQEQKNGQNSSLSSTNVQGGEEETTTTRTDV